MLLANNEQNYIVYLHYYYLILANMNNFLPIKDQNLYLQN